MSDSFREAKKRLAARKQKMSAVLQDIEQHEQERDDVSLHRAKFSDPKYSTSDVNRTMHEPTLTMENEQNKRKEPSAMTSQKEIETIMAVASDDKKNKVGKPGTKGSTYNLAQTKPYLKERIFSDRKESVAEQEIRKIMETTESKEEQPNTKSSVKSTVFPTKSKPTKESKVVGKIPLALSRAAASDKEISKMMETTEVEKDEKPNVKSSAFLQKFGPSNPISSKIKPINDPKTSSRIPFGPRRGSKQSGSTGRPATPDSATSTDLKNLKSATKFRGSDLSENSTAESDKDSDEEKGFIHIIEALTCFENAQFIFIQRLLHYNDLGAAGVDFKSDVDLAYQVINFDGQLLFLMQQQRVKCTGFIVYSKKSFENILYDIYGNKVLKFIGPSVFMSRMASKMRVADAHDRTLGYIKAFGTKVNYSVYNAIGERLFLVVSNLYIPSTTTDFTILCRGQKIGVIKYGWKHVFHELDFIDYETSGIEIPPEMDEREKALLLGCLMLIEFFWYSPLTRLKLSLLFVGIFIVVLAIIVLCIPVIVDNPDDDKRTKSYYIAEKLEAPKKIQKDDSGGKGG